MPFEVACSCGRSLRGPRQPSAQRIICPGCGRKRFIFPASSWTQRSASGLSSFALLTLPAARVNLRKRVLVILMGGAAAMGLMVLLIKPYLRRPADTEAETRTAADARALLKSAQRELREGNIHLARKHLQGAREQHGHQPPSLSREEHHRLNRLWRQCDLLAHLLDNPLEDILQQALQVHEAQEWREKFEDYRGRSILFEDVLRRDAAGRPILGVYVLRAGEVEARIALEELTLLRELPLEPPQRWLFGARLAGLQREDGGVWTLRLEPDSGVLLTDAEAAAACWPGLIDEDLRAVLHRQAEWMPQ